MQARCASSFKGTRKIHGTSRLLVDTWPTSWYGLFWCFHHPGSLARLLAHRLIMSNTSKQKKQKKTCKPIIKQKQRPSWDQKILMIGHLETANIPTVDDSEILLTGLRLVLNKPLYIYRFFLHPPVFSKASHFTSNTHLPTAVAAARCHKAGALSITCCCPLLRDMSDMTWVSYLANGQTFHFLGLHI